MIDLSVKEVVQVIDVRNWKRIKIQCGLPASTSAVVEAKRAFCYKTSSPSLSYATAKTLTLDGSAITPIDVTNTAYLHIVVTTADSGKQFLLEYDVSGPMRGEVVHRRLDAKYANFAHPAIHSGNHTRAFCIAKAGPNVSTAEFQIKRSVSERSTPLDFSPAKQLTLDGSEVLPIDLRDTPVLTPFCITAESGQSADIWVYLREETTSDQAMSGSEFPEDPDDWQEFVYTGDGFSEAFHYDPDRGKWLGELRSLFAARNYTGTGSGGGLTLAFDGVLLDDNTGFGIDHDFTIVGAEFTSKQAVSIDLDWHHAGVKQTTLMSMSSEANKSDYTLDYDETASVSNILRFELSNRTSGTIDDPVVKLWYRKNYTPT